MSKRITLSSDQLSWAGEQIRAAMESNKNRLKDLANSPALWYEAQCCAYIVALRKRTSGAKIAADAAPALHGWITRDPQLAQAAGVLARHQLGFLDIGTLPAALIAPPGEIETSYTPKPETIDMFAEEVLAPAM